MKPQRPASDGKIGRLERAARRGIGAWQNRLPTMADLYRRAQIQVRKQPKGRKSKAGDPGPKTELPGLLHELQVHQVELELQNEELRQARDEMEAARNKYCDLYDFAPVGYLTLDRDGLITEINLTGASLLGVSRPALLKRRFSVFVSPADRTVFNAFFQRVFESKIREECDVCLHLKGSTPVDVRMRAQVSDSSGACRLAVSDISDHKRAEAKLRVSEIRYRRLFESAHDGVLILDPATCKIMDANPFMTKLLGYSHAQLLGRELFEIGLLKDKAASQEMFQKLKRSHEVRYEDLPLKSKAGQHQEVEVVANLYRENGREVIQCNIREITERKAAGFNKNRLAAIVEFSADSIIGADTNGVITSWNRGAERIFGYPAAEIVGASIFTLIPADRRKEEERILKQIRAGHAVEQVETMRKTRAGRLINVSVTASPIKDAAGTVIGVSKVARDITERKSAEEAQHRVEVLAATNRTLHGEIMRRQAVEESLRKSEQHQTQLLAQSRHLQDQLRHLSRQILTAQEEERREISRELHDVIAQTLTGINLRLAALKLEAATKPRELDRHIARTQRMVEKSVEIVHQFARELRPAVLDDLGLIPALDTFLKSFSLRTSVRTHLTAFAAVEKLDPARRTVLYRVAQEALTNVARHAHASRVTLSLRKVPDGICMKIEDDGRAFDVQRVMQSSGKGRLGLLGMRERIEMVGGRFEIESMPGQGTTVVARIPSGPVRAAGMRRPT